MDGGTAFVEDMAIEHPARLRGTLYLPHALPDRAVLINGATGVPARYYAAFAEWIAAQGMACLIWDYRDFGRSGDPRRSSATMSDWGLADAEAVRAWLGRRLPGARLWVIGHSLGGVTLPFQRDLDGIERVIAVASGPVHLADHPWPYRALAAAFWYGHGPALTALLGHLPGRASGFGADLPAGVYRQWRRWCLDRGSALGDPAMPGLARPGFGGRATFIAIADDVMVPPAAVWRLMPWFPDAFRNQRTLRPAEHGLAAIGHIAAFAPRCRAVWPQILA